MPEVTNYPPGTFCWIELATTDSAAAKRFYSELFLWRSRDNTLSSGMTYTMLLKNSNEVGALYQMSKDDIAGGYPKWLSYISVPNVERTLARARGLGARVLNGPSEVSDMGRAALIQDPEGALLALWQPEVHIGAAVINEPGALCWNELATRDAVRATAFYTRLFGWTPKLSGPAPSAYTELLNGIIPVGGIIQIKQEWKEVPPHWMIYLCVEDCDGSMARAGALGARVAHGPTDIPGVGRFAILRDPQGAYFAIIQLKPKQRVLNTEPQPSGRFSATG